MVQNRGSIFYFNSRVYFSILSLSQLYSLVLLAQPVSRSVSHVNLDFLLEAEELIVEVRPVLA
jgi:hypothetical protein